MALDFEDFALRQAAFDHVRLLIDASGPISSSQLRAGFIYRGERIPLINPQRGIFKPARMKSLLSITTVFPKPGGRVWYDDQRDVHRKIFQSEDTVDYAFMGKDPNAADNRWLREAMEEQVPIIYFLGVSPGQYEAILPTFVVGWDPGALNARLAFAPADAGYVAAPETTVERRYALREVKQRLHQASFREIVIAAYDGRCALTGLPEPRLLDAAHIISDSDQDFGHPLVTNGIPLSKTHHAAFDGHLIGIDPDYRIHVSERLLSLNDGPMLQLLKSLHGGALQQPRRDVDGPDRDRLAIRFERFRNTA
jgi:putative restriction endonuclease